MAQFENRLTKKSSVIPAQAGIHLPPLALVALSGAGYRLAPV
jgi:hypothetical protein